MNGECGIWRTEVEVSTQESWKDGLQQQQQKVIKNDCVCSTVTDRPCATHPQQRFSWPICMVRPISTLQVRLLKGLGTPTHSNTQAEHPGGHLPRG